jgi:hypothetical protein
MSSSPEPFSIHEIAHDTGGRLALARLPGRTGALEADLGSIVDWAPRTVVSMTELDEAERYGAAGLGAGLEAVGIRHEIFPIRDFGTPETAETEWPALAMRLHAVLDTGGGVLLHCLGGKGRSGMVALRLLVERGMKPAKALEAIRVARPGAVETAAQESWGVGGRARAG